MGLNKIIALAITIAILCFVFNMFNRYEGFNEQVGRFCHTCSGKNFNQCTGCFNCGFCVDKWGNSGCIGGDYKGPYNYEKCAYWYTGDPFTKMLQMNKDYKRSYGPDNASRLIS